MTALRAIYALTLAVLFTLTAPDKAQAGQGPHYVRLGAGAPALLYEPETTGPNSAIAVISMHSGADYLTHSSCTELSKRGFRVLCANNSNSKSGVSDDGVIDRVLIELKAAVIAMRTIPGVKAVVLFGHSGGATTMSAYQMIAENGVASCNGAEKIYKCSNSLAGLVPADGLMLIDANWGQSTMALLSIDPAVKDERSGMKLNPALDLFNPRNGFVASGSSYTPAFVNRYLDAAGRRSRAINEAALKRLALIEAGKGRYSDDEPFDVPGASFLGWNNKLYAQDVRLLSRSIKPWPLIHADGSVTVEMIRSVRPALNRVSETHSYLRGAIKTTVRNYLATYAIRTTQDFGYGETSEIRGIVWASSYSNAPGNVQSISAPLLTMGMTGGWEGLAAETIHTLAKSKDKTIAFVEGATHIYTPCSACEKTPGQYGDTVKTTYDYIAQWLAEPGRFLKAGY